MVVNAHQSAPKMEPDVLFPPSWQGLRQQIIYLAQFGNSIQVIHGRSGAGKSTFFRHSLENGLGSPTIGVQVRPGEGLEAFFREVVEEIGLRPAPDASVGQLISMLRGFVQTINRDRSRAVLLVDDAHHLDDSELGALVSVLQGHAEPGIGLHVVLFAEPGFANHLDELQVLDVAVHDAPLPQFTAAEMHQLLKLQRLRPNIAVDSKEQVQSIWHQSQGLPGVAISLLEELRPAPSADAVFSLRGLPVGHMAALIVLCAVLVWAFLARQPSESSNEKTTSSLEIPTAPAPAPAAQILEPPASPPPVTDRPRAQVDAPQAPESEISLQDVPPPAPTEQNPPVAADTQTPAVEQPSRAVEQNDSSQPKPAVAKPGIPVDADTNSEAAVAFDTANMTSGGSQVAKPAATSSLVASERQLLAYRPNGYVLQLMATLDLDKLMSFIAQQPNAAHLHLYSTVRNNRPLYILVEGYYADKDSALAAVANLPAKQREGGPWPKKVEQVQQEIQKSRKL